ncbi:PepSY-associated TM helix domain-containing protein [Nocardia sp. NPDC052254]|uniref:PepSY-associated TM helix domain-containing protein n=1 Tax=Nocardia sp. NPDC052254 TaxID=3155681 RepID=UPI003443FCE6
MSGVETRVAERRVVRRRARKPVRRALTVAHRWSALILGIVLVVQCTSGAVLLYHSELFRASHSVFYRHTEGTVMRDANGAADFDRAVALVRAQDPGFAVGWAGTDDGVIVVGDVDFTEAYGIDPGSGRINDRIGLTGGVLGWLVDLHDCAFGCLRYAGAVPALNSIAPLIGITWAATILGVIGLLLVVLAISGAVIWWPTLKRWRHGFRVRTSKGRFARDRDLHNVIGIVSVPFLLMWGITGAAIEVPAVQKAWLAITGGQAATDLPQDAFRPRDTPTGQPEISASEAARIATGEHSGRVAYVMLPADSTPYYRVNVAGGYSPYEHRALYSGDVLVYVNAHDASDTKVVDAAHDRPLANTFYAKVFEPAHFGWLVNGWWRLIWLIFGLTPLALAITGTSTWLFKRRVRASKRT